ncbi:hypothetical protein [Crocosphaera chwakensis]|uniref:Uncharacterized protein n=1 Tax=Crocosphaera chwakensis CCY0110 TaxID=391612 RepID=A3IR93_9CHRO|nr:hypothetical protein [Crocosphaera chwakensis]EAZ91083.1 hypothetical protein CY0110_27765 [Crocosphaera chwakensis CCY0110]
MTTHFIEAEIDLQQTHLTLKEAVEEALQEQGAPLRWAITKVNKEKQTAQVEAIVTTANSQ